MSAATIDGKAVADRLRARVGEGVAALKAARGIAPGLAAVLVGDDPASHVYVRNKAKQTAEIGMASFEHYLPDSTSQADLLALVGKLNADPKVHGILVQLPLPKQIDPQAVLLAIDPAKDVDGFHPINVGRLGAAPAVTAEELAADPLDAGRALDFPIPGTPLGCLMLLKLTLGPGGLRGKDALVIGRSNIVGKPMAQLLLREDCTVTVAHSRTRDLPDLCRRAEILVAAIGRPKFVPADWIRPGATVIDVGVNRIPKVEEPGKTRLVGDVDTAAARAVAGAITPVPGGVGPMTIACLLANTLRAASRT